MTTEFGPCNDWPVKWPCDVSAYSPNATGSAVSFATEVVWALSGRQFGVCRVTLRPCRRECLDYSWPWEITGWTSYPAAGNFVTPLLHDGQWFNIVCGQCTTDCSCSYVPEVVLPHPVDTVVEVKIDGSILSESAYRVDNHRLLVRTDGDDWPRCNDLSKSDSEVDTWSVTARYGREVPEGGAWAVGELACEFLRAFTGEDCRLPRNVTQIARQGVTISYPDVNNIFSNGRTGLYLTDIFIASWNPNRLTNRSRTYNVDAPQHRQAGTG